MLDDAYWYGTTMSLKGRHARQIAAWEDAYEESQNALLEWRQSALSAEDRAERLASLNDQMLDCIKKMGERLNFLEEIARKALEMDENLKALRPIHAKLKSSQRLESIKARVEYAQKERYKHLFQRLLDYVPGLRDDLLSGGRSVLEEGLSAYEAALQKQGITSEVLAELKSTGYDFAPVSSRFGVPALPVPAEEQKSSNPPTQFDPPEAIQLRGVVDDLVAKGKELSGRHNDLVARHNDLLDRNFYSSYEAALNKAEAKGHKAVLELVRKSPADVDIDTPHSDIPAPSGQCDSLATSTFKRAYVAYLVECNATKDDLARIAAETDFEFPFPVVEYMEWMAAHPVDDVLPEVQSEPVCMP